ncbi:MAG: HdeD family acid-resistance protein [Roseiarcus sp.]|jgi:uncharacterized membrane protein HdeD (DUF308 family)
MSDSRGPGREVHSLGGAIHRLHEKWGAIVAFGVLLILLGLAAMMFSVFATIATVTINGVVFLIAGAAEIGIGMHSQGWGRFFLWVIGGVLYLFVGLVCIFNPVLASTALTLVLGAGLIAAGVVRVYLASQLPAEQPRAMVFVAGAVTILLGLIIVTHWPADSIWVLGTLLGVDLLFNGAGWVNFGLGLRARR